MLTVNSHEEECTSTHEDMKSPITAPSPIGLYMVYLRREISKTHVNNPPKSRKADPKHSPVDTVYPECYVRNRKLADEDWVLDYKLTWKNYLDAQ